MSHAVREVGGEDWPTWREMRLRALADSPSAFGSTYTREVAFTEQDWRRRLAGDGVCVLVEDDGLPVGMGAGFLNTANAAARRCYERYGFAVTGETRPLREGSDEMVERMVLATSTVEAPCT